MPPTPEQINRGLGIAESLVSLATDVWQHRKSQRRASPKPATARRKATKRTLPAAAK